MLSQKTFYHNTTKNAIIAFGNLFNDIHVERYDATGTLAQRLKVPLTYAPKEKYLAREQQQANIDVQNVEIILPRMAFEITGTSRAAERQMQGLQQRRTVVNGQVNSGFNPVPYDLTVSLYAMAKTQDDALQIMEQIVPMFNPTFTVSMKAIPELNLLDDLPVTLDTVSHEDNYDAAFEQRREIVWTFNFTLQLNYYGPVQTNRAVIKHTDVTLYSQPEMVHGEEMENISTEVVPFIANNTDPHTITTVYQISGFN
jgi:hypothetical protein